MLSNHDSKNTNIILKGTKSQLGILRPHAFKSGTLFTYIKCLTNWTQSYKVILNGEQI